MLRLFKRPGSSLPGLRRRVRLPIAAVLVGGFGTLMLVAVTSVLVLGTGIGVSSTFSLLRDKASLALDNVQTRLQHQLDPVAIQANFLAARVLSGELDTTDVPTLSKSLELALAATPQVTGLGFISAERMTGVMVARVDGRYVTKTVTDASDVADLSALLADARNRPSPHWGDPIWEEGIGASLVTLVRPIYRQDRFIGLIAAGVSLSDLSAFLSELYLQDGIRAFVLYDRTHVLAHRNLPQLDLDYSQSEGPPLPRIDEVGDPVLAGIWDGRETEEFGDGIIVTESAATDGGEEYIVLTRPTVGYGSRPWSIGIVFPAEEATAELQRFGIAAAVGVGILLVSVGLALLIGIPISRKIRRLAEAADALAALEFNRAPTLPDSRFREFAHASAAVNGMISGLRWCETYVPKALVLRLIRSGTSTALESEERMVTVMFTDIRGFSTLAERMSAADTAALLNSHFAALAGCIEAEGGTVDKFIGDAVMAFWGAPEDQPDHAARALRAALAIDRTVRVDNAVRRRRGVPTLPVRVGLYTGPAVVGNIGAPSRINYTIVGDTVNTAARIEALASTLQRDGDDCLILAGAATLRAAAFDVPHASVGRHVLRGLSSAVEVFRIGGPAEAGRAAG